VDWKWPLCLAIVVIGAVLFLYGANFYNNAVGWTGVYFFIGGIFLYVLLRVFADSAKGAVDQKP
jgi:hypothetical protein